MGTVQSRAEELYRAAARGNEAQVRRLIEGATAASRAEALEWRNAQGRTAIGVAVEHGHVAIVSMLIGAGGDIIWHGPKQSSLLHSAVLRCPTKSKKEIIRALCRGGASLTPKENGSSALEMARSHGCLISVRTLEQIFGTFSGWALVEDDSNVLWRSGSKWRKKWVVVVRPTLSVVRTGDRHLAVYASAQHARPELILPLRTAMMLTQRDAMARVPHGPRSEFCISVTSSSKRVPTLCFAAISGSGPMLARAIFNVEAKLPKYGDEVRLHASNLVPGEGPTEGPPPPPRRQAIEAPHPFPRAQNPGPPPPPRRPAPAPGPPPPVDMSFDYRPSAPLMPPSAPPISTLVRRSNVSWSERASCDGNIFSCSASEAVPEAIAVGPGSQLDIYGDAPFATAVPATQYK